jgi:protease I
MRLTGKKIACLVEDGFEDLEFWVPVTRLRPDFWRELVSALAGVA